MAQPDRTEDREAENPYRAPMEGQAIVDRPGAPLGSKLFAALCYAVAAVVFPLGALMLMVVIAGGPADDAVTRWSSGGLGIAFVFIGAWLVWRGNRARREIHVPNR